MARRTLRASNGVPAFETNTHGGNSLHPYLSLSCLWLDSCSVLAKVEQAFLVIKRILGWATVRYRELAKNTHWLVISCVWANFYVASWRLLATVERMVCEQERGQHDRGRTPHNPRSDQRITLIAHVDPPRNRFLCANVN